MDKGNKVCILINVCTENKTLINREKNVSEVNQQREKERRKKEEKMVQIERNCYLKGIKVCTSFILMNFRYRKSNINQRREEEKGKKRKK